jgi:predicted ATP-dependent Lon-type protease
VPSDEYPHGEFSKEDVRECLEYAFQVRRRVKEQLKKIGGMEFYDVHFSYIDNDSLEEHFVMVKEQGGGALIPEGPGKPGFIHTIGLSNKGMPGLYRLEGKRFPHQRLGQSDGPRFPSACGRAAKLRPPEPYGIS